MAKILLLDDNETILKIVSSVLNSKSHKVTLAKNPIDAFESILQDSFDLIITDLVLPGGTNGFDFIRTVRNNSVTAKIPIIVITGERKEKKDVERAITAGANDYIVKPINPETLQSKVSHWLTVSAQPPKPSSNFKIVNAIGVLNTEVKVLTMTEIGFEMKTLFSFQVESKIKVECASFREIGIATPWVKVITCVRSQAGDGYDVSVQFVDLTEKETGSIKQWIRLSIKKAS